MTESERIPIRVKIITPGRQGVYIAFYGGLKYSQNRMTTTTDKKVIDRLCELYGFLKRNPYIDCTDIEEEDFIKTLQASVINNLEEADPALYKTLLDLSMGADIPFNEFAELNFLKEFGITKRKFNIDFTPSKIQNSKETKEKKEEFYKYLGESISKHDKISCLELKALAYIFSNKYLTGDQKKIIIPVYNYEGIPTATLLKSDPIQILFVEEDDVNYYYWTLTDASRIEVGKPEIIKLGTDITNSIKEKNILISYKSSEKKFDTVDYFKIGVNRHNQVARLIQEKKQQYAILNEETDKANIRKTIRNEVDGATFRMSQKIVLESLIQDDVNKEIFNVLTQSRRDIIIILKDSNKQLTKLIEQAFVQLGHAQQELVKTIMLQITETQERQIFLMQKIDIARLERNDKTTFEIWKQLRTDAQHIKEVMNELKMGHADIYGLVKVNVQKIQDKVVVATKGMEAMVNTINTVSNNILTELLNINDQLSKIRQQLVDEIARAQQEEGRLDAEFKRLVVELKDRLELFNSVISQNSATIDQLNHNGVILRAEVAQNISNANMAVQSLLYNAATGRFEVRS